MLFTQHLGYCNPQPSSGSYLRTQYPSWNFELKTFFFSINILKGYFASVRIYLSHSPLYRVLLSLTMWIFDIARLRYRTHNWKKNRILKFWSLILMLLVRKWDRICVMTQLLEYPLFSVSFCFDQRPPHDIHLYAMYSEKIIIV